MISTDRIKLRYVLLIILACGPLVLALGILTAPYVICKNVVLWAFRKGAK